MRVLHVIGSANPGGTETWLLNSLRHLPVGCNFEFCVFDAGVGRYERELINRGATITRCVRAGRSLASFWRDLRALMQNGGYDIVHSHVHFFSGVVLSAAAAAGVANRVAHAHTGAPESQLPLWKRGYPPLMRALINKYATAGLAASSEAATALYGRNWHSDRRWRTLYCGVDLSPFTTSARTPEMRADLGLPADAVVVGYVGRLVAGKNLRVLISAAGELARLEPRAILLIAGDGPLRLELEEHARREGTPGGVRFLGYRPDIPALLTNVIDVLCLPSLFEGLPISILEAQAAGVPVVISDVITREVEALPELIHRCSVGARPIEWANAIAASYRAGHAPHRALQAFARTPFDMAYSVDQLYAFYNTILPPTIV